MKLVRSFKRYLSEAISWAQEKDRYMRVFTGMTGGMGQKEGKEFNGSNPCGGGSLFCCRRF